ncbi:hypothetical protein, partial [Bremerella sp.]|uniref:hypothetical protein n=1 Tax=Bremerella sp. TaxID=2795602 RepID=UPI003919FC8A
MLSFQLDRKERFVSFPHGTLETKHFTLDIGRFRRGRCRQSRVDSLAEMENISCSVKRRAYFRHVSGQEEPG